MTRIKLNTGQSFTEIDLFAECALYIPANNTLVVTDTHWGKEASFQARGLPIPAGATADDLRRLSALIKHTQAARVIIIGDLLHDAYSLTDTLIETVSRWRQQHIEQKIVLVEGNHDRHVKQLPESWAIERVGDCLAGGHFIYRHLPQPDAAGYVLAGHLHPAVELTGRGREYLKLPCFWFGPAVGVLPAFGSFTGNALVQAQPGDSIYAVTDKAVLKIR